MLGGHQPFAPRKAIRADPFAARVEKRFLLLYAEWQGVVNRELHQLLNQSLHIAQIQFEPLQHVHSLWNSGDQFLSDEFA
jgi:hypothetical protein